MASYNRPQGGPSRPLISRPQSTTRPLNPYPQPSQLGNSIAGALSAIHNPVHYSAPYPPAGTPYWPQPSHSLPPPNPYQNYQPQPGYGYPADPNPYGHPAYSYPPQGGAYPPQNYAQYSHPGPSNGHQPQQPQLHHSLPQNPTRNTQLQTPARTTAAGYTISSTYIPPPPQTQPQSHPKPAAVRPPKQREQPTARPPQPRPEPKPAKAKGPGGQQAGGGGGGAGGPSGQVFTCQVADCPFTGTKRTVREHEEDRHLIYLPGKEPPAWSGSYKPVNGALIEGTSLTLDSPEAVAKWIEDRKKRWPSHKVVEEKEKLYPGSTARGGRGGRGGRGRGRGGRLSRPNGGAGGIWGEQPPDEQLAAPPAAHPMETETTTVNGAVDEEPARKKIKREAADGVDDDDQSDGGGESAEESDDDGPPAEAGSRVPVPALFPKDGGAEEPAPSGRPSIHPSRLQVDGEGPVEVDADADAARSKSSATIVCRYFKSGKCHQGDQCPFLHVTSDTPAPPPKRKRPAPPPPAFNPFARADPFAQLAERDWSHLVSDALQAIEFLEGNNWLRGVELRAGQIEEEGGIQVLAEAEAETGATREGEDELMGGREAGIEEVEEGEDGGEGVVDGQGAGEMASGEDEDDDEDEAVADLLISAGPVGAEATVAAGED